MTRKRYFTLLFSLSVLITVLIPIAVRGQAELRLSTLQVNLWPEYDHPDMLVIYSFELPANTTLPTSITFRIPATVKQPNGYGYYAQDGERPVQEEYSQRIEGDWLVVTFSLRSLRGTLEYYDDSLTKNDTNRSFTYTWPGDYGVDSLVLMVQQPAGASGLTLSVPAGEPKTGSDSLLYYSVSAGGRKFGETYQLKVNYQKSSSGLSSDSMQVRPASPLPENNPWQIVPWVLGILGGVLIIGAITWYWMISRRGNPSQPHKRRRVSKEPTPPVAGEGAYCHQCGRRAASGDLFCRSCGAQLRIE